MNAGRIRHPYLRLLSLLLEYPAGNFPAKLSEIERYLATAEARSHIGHELLVKAVGQMRTHDLLALQQLYVQTFDLTSAHALNLSAHLLDEQDRRRGSVLIGLRRHYAAAGLEMIAGELPDYLPLVLEFAATLDDQAAAAFMGEIKEATAILASNLRRADSLYAAVVEAVTLTIEAYKRAPETSAMES